MSAAERRAWVGGQPHALCGEYAWAPLPPAPVPFTLPELPPALLPPLEAPTAEQLHAADPARPIGCLAAREAWQQRMRAADAAAQASNAEGAWPFAAHQQERRQRAAAAVAAAAQKQQRALLHAALRRDASVRGLGATHTAAALGGAAAAPYGEAACAVDGLHGGSLQQQQQQHLQHQQQREPEHGVQPLQHLQQAKEQPQQQPQQQPQLHQQPQEQLAGTPRAHLEHQPEPQAHLQQPQPLQPPSLAASLAEGLAEGLQEGWQALLGQRPLPELQQELPDSAHGADAACPPGGSGSTASAPGMRPPRRKWWRQQQPCGEWWHEEWCFDDSSEGVTVLELCLGHERQVTALAVRREGAGTAQAPTKVYVGGR